MTGFNNKNNPHYPTDHFQDPSFLSTLALHDFQQLLIQNPFVLYS